MNKIYQKPFPGAKNAGFTLIELLVVVLIIGILSAAALPKYQKAVNKTKLANAVALIKPFADAEEIYYMANGKYTPSAEDLDLEPPAGGVASASDKGYIRYPNGTMDLLANANYITGGNGALVGFAFTKERFGVFRFLQNSSYPNTWVCADGEGTFCQSLGGAAFAPGIPGFSGKAYYLPL